MTDMREARHITIPVKVGGVTVGGGAPIVVQSMTNTDTADVDATVKQVAALAQAGSELVRVTVDRDEAAAAVPHIRDRLLTRWAWMCRSSAISTISATSCCASHPACAEALAKYRINPGNVGFRDKRDKQFSDIIEIALKHDKPVRIGVNWGSLDQELLARMMDDNAKSAKPREAREVLHEAIVHSATASAELAQSLGMGAEKIILSAKVSAVQDLISVYAMLASRCNYALHLGLTEAGMGSKGIVASSAAHGHSACSRASAIRSASRSRRRRAARAPRKSRSRSKSCRPWASAPSCRSSRRVPAAGAPRPRCSRRWRRTSRSIS